MSEVSFESVCVEPLPLMRFIVLMVFFANFATREAFASVVKVIEGLLKFGEIVLLSGFAQPRKEYPGLFI